MEDISLADNLETNEPFWFGPHSHDINDADSRTSATSQSSDQSFASSSSHSCNNRNPSVATRSSWLSCLTTPWTTIAEHVLHVQETLLEESYDPVTQKYQKVVHPSVVRNSQGKPVGVIQYETKQSIFIPESRDSFLPGENQNPYLAALLSQLELSKKSSQKSHDLVKEINSFCQKKSKKSRSTYDRLKVDSEFKVSSIRDHNTIYKNLKLTINTPCFPKNKLQNKIIDIGYTKQPTDDISQRIEKYYRQKSLEAGYMEQEAKRASLKKDGINKYERRDSTSYAMKA